MPIGVTLNFEGHCREAVAFYARVFGLDMPEILTFRDAPPDSGMDVPEKYLNRVMHTSMIIQGTEILFSDNYEITPVVVGNNMGIIVTTDNDDEITAWFNALQEGGSVVWNLEKVFWSRLYGAVIDRFGISWQIMHTEPV